MASLSKVVAAPPAAVKNCKEFIETTQVPQASFTSSVLLSMYLPPAPSLCLLPSFCSQLPSPPSLPSLPLFPFHPLPSRPPQLLTAGRATCHLLIPTWKSFAACCGSPNPSCG